MEIASTRDSAEAGNELGELALVTIVAERLALKTAEVLRRTNADDDTVIVFTSLGRNDETAREFAMPLSDNSRARREMLEGVEALEQSMGYASGDDHAQAGSGQISSVSKGRWQFSAGQSEKIYQFERLWASRCDGIPALERDTYLHVPAIPRREDERGK